MLTRGIELDLKPLGDTARNGGSVRESRSGSALISRWSGANEH